MTIPAKSATPKKTPGEHKQIACVHAYVGKLPCRGAVTLQTGSDVHMLLPPSEVCWQAA